MSNDPAPITLDPERDPWEQQPGETDRQYGQFSVYRDLGKARTVAKTAETVAKNASYLRRVAAAGKWRDRAAAYDRHLDQIHEAAWAEECRKAAQADARILGAAAGKIAQRLAALNPEQLSAGDLIRMMDVVMRQRRQLLGLATPSAAAQPAGDPDLPDVVELQGLTAEERRYRIREMTEGILRLPPQQGAS